jgi:peptidoglycan/xylan/chitin deacetylase (PgdA/CDA1 family)
MNVSGLYTPLDAPTGALRTARRTLVRTAAHTLGSRWFRPAWAPLERARAAFVTLHRFAEPELGFFGHDRELFRRGLERLRKDGYALLGVDDAMRRLADGSGFPKRAVVFTMDDGYRGALEQSADLFEAYDCPLTVFVPTGFIDGTTWMWWDQVEYACLTSGQPRLRVEWDDRTVDLDLGSKRAAVASLIDVCNWCKTLTDEAKWRFIRQLADVAGVTLPRSAPAEYAALSWDEMRAFEARGIIRFGPHTVTHPILPQVTDAAAKWEIETSWARVQEELRSPIDVFSYPNGMHGRRELDIMAGTTMRGAVTTRHGYAATPNDAVPGAGRFEIPRFGYPEVPHQLQLIASGFRSLELTLKGGVVTAGGR